MSPDKPPGRLLIIDGDTMLVRTVRQHFEYEGYQVHTATTCQEGLSLATTARPNLILLAAQMPDMAGLDVFRALRDRPRTGHIPVMMLAAQNEMILQNKVLAEGAYDFIEKPLDLDILTLRVRNALRRAEREGLTEPRTGLPTGRLIDERVSALVGEPGWYKMVLTIDGFNVFRDLYGFVTANEALRFAGNLIAQITNECGSPDDFVGHPGGTEEFVIITTQAHGPALRKALVQRISRELQSFYNFMERDQGYVLVEGSTGEYVQKPLMSAQVKVTQGEPDDPWVDAVETEDNTTDSMPDDTPPGSAFGW